MSESGTLRWGILSTARIIEELLPGFAAAPDAELLAVASRDGARAERFAAEAGIERSYGSYSELLADPEIDCVYVPLPNGMHAEWARAALAAGKHVLCEKPLTPSAEEAASLFDQAEGAGLVLMEAFMFRHHPKTRVLREIAASGRIGEPRVLRSKFHFTVEDPASDIRYDAGLAGGALRDVGCYCVSLSNFLAGAAPEQIGASARIADSGVDEVFTATMSYANGMLAVFDCGMVSPLDVGAELLGTEGRAVLEMPWYAHLEPLSVTVYDAEGNASVEAAPGGNAYQLEIENFCAAVRGMGAPRSPRGDLRGTWRRSSGCSPRPNPRESPHEEMTTAKKETAEVSTVTNAQADGAAPKPASEGGAPVVVRVARSRARLTPRSRSIVDESPRIAGGRSNGAAANVTLRRRPRVRRPLATPHGRCRPDGRRRRPSACTPAC